MKARRSFFLRFWLVASAALAASPALSLVGPAQPDDSFASHLVVILKSEGGRAGYCTGVVLAPRAILTAAHCASSAGNLRVYYRDGGGAAVFKEIAAVAIHPRYRPDSIAKRVASVDLALVETRAPLESRFSPAALDESGSAAIGAPLRIYGFGVAREGEGTSAGVLRGASLAVRAPLSSLLLWAEDPEHGGIGACTGDSGGPIVSADDGKVLAITAWSAGAGHGSRCGALTQGALVAPQRAWIDAVLNRWSGQ